MGDDDIENALKDGSHEQQQQYIDSQLQQQQLPPPMSSATSSQHNDKGTNGGHGEGISHDTVDNDVPGSSSNDSTAVATQGYAILHI